MSDAELILIVTASYAGAIGYAEVYTCQVRARIAGNLEENEIRLTVLAGDKETIEFFSAHPPPQEIKLGFTVGKTGEPYRLAPISGFVDQDNTSWTIRYVREAQR